ncbi:GTPase HflX [Candidatus Fermentibacterales bacterium]|nr:GTPase HflX [Candidatus Fermentibacterales bacterium]
MRARSRVSETAAPREKMILVEVELDGEFRGRQAHEEMLSLISGAGGEVVGAATQHRSAPDATSFVGRGKVEELGALAEQAGATSVVFDHNLSPGQVARIEEATGCKVLDRTELILAIFALQARTREAMLQIELAQLTYALPRLSGMWHHLSRLGGGIGTRGPGETQLEVDRRRARSRIRILQRQLERIDREWHLRAGRRSEVFQVAMVGYTNSGKSTLMNALCQSSVLVADRPFATLDATSRRLELPGSRGTVVLSDTVGFIERLPETLVASFRTTLGVVREADLLLVVSDCSSSDRLHRLEVVETTLERIGASAIPRMVVWNKADLLEEGTVLPAGGVEVSALTRAGLPALLESIDMRWARSLQWFELTAQDLPPRLENWIRENCWVDEMERTTGGIRVSGGIRPGIGRLRARLESEGLGRYTLSASGETGATR